MTVKETSEVMDILIAAYPKFYYGKTAAELKKALMLWACMFEADAPGTVLAAVKAFISGDTKGFPPVVGQIKEIIRKFTVPPERTETEAWSLVVTALKNSSYNSAAEFAALPLEIQRIIGSPNQLKEWAMMDVETLQSVVASNFQRSYRARIASVREYIALPEDVKAAFGNVFRPIALEGRHEGT